MSQTNVQNRKKEENYISGIIVKKGENNLSPPPLKTHIRFKVRGQV